MCHNIEGRWDIFFFINKEGWGIKIEKHWGALTPHRGDAFYGVQAVLTFWFSLSMILALGEASDFDFTYRNLL